MSSAEYIKAWRAKNPDYDKIRYANKRSDERIRYRNSTRTWRKRNPIKTSWSKMKARAKQYDREMSITYEQFELLFKPMTCSRTGINLKWTEGVRQPFNPSVDRIANTKGYTVKNTQIVCLMYNLAKSQWTDKEVLTMAKALCIQQN